MNYNSVQEIFDAGTENMTAVRNNSKNDDGTDTVVGVDWFTFGGVIASNVYVSGNSWFGFGASSEQLKVNRRDAASWYVYREEGTLFDYYNFLKIRWSGYSYYNQTSSAYKLEYDVILWDTGAISLHMVAIPTQYNNGTYTLSGTAYTVSDESPDVTFSFTEDGDLVIANEMINLIPPFDKKWLVASESALYTTKNGMLESLGADTSLLSAEIFQTFGADAPPEWELLQALENPQIFYWFDSAEYAPQVSATMNAAPLSQTLISERIELTDSTILGIESVSVDCDGELIAAVSFDEKQTWLAYNGERWVGLSGEFSGMSKETLESITVDQWQELYAGADAMYIRAAFVSAQQAIRQIYIKFLN